MAQHQPPGKAEDPFTAAFKVGRGSAERRRGWAFPLALAAVLIVVTFLPRHWSVGDLLPVVVSFALAIVGMFHVVYRSLWHGAVPWTSGAGAAAWLLALALLGLCLFSVGTYLVVRVYLWELLDAIPAVEVTDTVGWQRPVEHPEAGLGLALLAYRATVLVPILAVVVRIWKDRRAAEAAQNA